ncbi:MAG: hypothetical protein LUI08_04135 [Prevotella sp.]|nr:hypothetical protein [Prevotella sp.]
MPQDSLGQPFAMPMYKDWFPVRPRPWCYLAMILVFQLTAGLYLGNVSLIAGEGGMMQEDVMFIGLCNVVGINMPFPLLFKFKFHFSNNRLLLNATAMMLLCNLACMYVRSVPLLAVLAFVEGFFKPCATFECFSNIQLWITAKRDLRVFFPVLYIFIAGTMSLQSYLAVNIAYLFEGWRMMHWFVIGLLLCCLLFQFTCLRKYYIMRLTFKSVDWFGMLLWSLLYCCIVWIFTYGEYYNWGEGKVWRDVCVMTVIVLLCTVGRMCNIRHPYITPEIFKNKAIYPILSLFFIGEWFSTTPKVLGTAFVGEVLHWGVVSASVLDLYVWLGVLIGSGFSFLWMKVWRLSYPHLCILGFISLLAYQWMMYFLISPDTNIEALYLPMVLRGIGYDVFLVVCTIELFEVMSFETFFMGIALSGFMRNGPTSAIVTGIYNFFLRREEASSLAAGIVTERGDTVLIALKEVFGATCLIGCFILIVLLVADIKPVRSSMKLMPSWFSVGKMLRQREKHDENMRRKAALLRTV